MKKRINIYVNGSASCIEIDLIDEIDGHFDLDTFGLDELDRIEESLARWTEKVKELRAIAQEVEDELDDDEPVTYDLWGYLKIPRSNPVFRGTFTDQNNAIEVAEEYMKCDSYFEMQLLSSVPGEMIIFRRD
jgi:hypothetical protein